MVGTTDAWCTCSLLILYTFSVTLIQSQFLDVVGLVVVFVVLLVERAGLLWGLDNKDSRPELKTSAPYNSEVGFGDIACRDFATAAFG